MNVSKFLTLGREFMASGALRQKIAQFYLLSYVFLLILLEMDVLHCDTYEVNGRIYRRNVPLNVNLGLSLKGDFDLPDQVEEDEYDSDIDYGERFLNDL